MREQSPVTANAPTGAGRPPAGYSAVGVTAAGASAHSLVARLTARAFALAVDPDRSAEVAVPGLIGLAQGSTIALEAALQRSRWRQFERPSAVADAAARLLK